MPERFVLNLQFSVAPEFFINPHKIKNYEFDEDNKANDLHKLLTDYKLPSIFSLCIQYS